MEMSKVTQCEVSSCAYNIDSCCHAFAITVGDSSVPRCDTLCMSSSKCDNESSTAGVGACKTSACQHNMGLECSAPEITVGYQGSEVDCLTFRQR